MKHSFDVGSYLKVSKISFTLHQFFITNQSDVTASHVLLIPKRKEENSQPESTSHSAIKLEGTGPRKKWCFPPRRTVGLPDCVLLKSAKQSVCGGSQRKKDGVRLIITYSRWAERRQRIGYGCNEIRKLPYSGFCRLNLPIETPPTSSREGSGIFTNKIA